MTNEEDVEKKKGSMIFSLVSYVSINCIRFTGMISAQSTPTNNEIQSIYFEKKGKGFITSVQATTYSRKRKYESEDNEENGWGTRIRT